MDPTRGSGEGGRGEGGGGYRVKVVYAYWMVSHRLTVMIVDGGLHFLDALFQVVNTAGELGKVNYVLLHCAHVSTILVTTLLNIHS